MSFFGLQNVKKIVSFWGLVSRSFSYRFLIRNFRRLGLPNPGFRIEGTAQIDFHGNRFFINLGIDFLLFFGSLGSGFSGFLGLENKLENPPSFSDTTGSESGFWWGRSPGYLGPL